MIFKSIIINTNMNGTGMMWNNLFRCILASLYEAVSICRSIHNPFFSKEKTEQKCVAKVVKHVQGCIIVPPVTCLFSPQKLYDTIHSQHVDSQFKYESLAMPFPKIHNLFVILRNTCKLGKVKQSIISKSSALLITGSGNMCEHPWAFLLNSGSADNFLNFWQIRKESFLIFWRSR